MPKQWLLKKGREEEGANRLLGIVLLLVKVGESENSVLRVS